MHNERNEISPLTKLVYILLRRRGEANVLDIYILFWFFRIKNVFTRRKKNMSITEFDIEGFGISQKYGRTCSMEFGGIFSLSRSEKKGKTTTSECGTLVKCLAQDCDRDRHGSNN